VRAWQLGAMTALVGLLAIAGRRHEPWFDEAQAWLIARDDDLWDLLSQRMRHEGSTPLWHLLLIAPARLGAPYRTLALVSGAATVAGGWLFVRRAPFAPWVRATVPLSYFVLYQYGVVARSYSLLAPLLFAAAMAFPERRAHPWRWTLPLLGVALTCVHGLLIALCWEGWRAVELWREWSRADHRERRRRSGPVIVMAVVAALAIAELWPSRDTVGGGSWHFDVGAITALLSNGPLSVLQVAAVGAVIASLPGLRRRGALALFAIPGSGLVLFFLGRYFSPWHAGIVLLLWIASLWIAVERPQRSSTPAGGRRPFAAVLTVVIVLQLAWSARSIAFDLAEPYSGAAALATYIRGNHLEHRIAAWGRWIVAVHPYFDGMVIANYNGGHGPAYDPWSRAHEPLPRALDRVVAGHREAIVVSVEARHPVRVPCLPGYRLDRVFEGHIFVGDHPLESETYVVFRRDPAAPLDWDRVCVTVE
jgi:hypothetical protein